MSHAPVANAAKAGRSSLIPRAVLFADPTFTSVRISPDGRRIAYLAPLDGILNLWVAPLASPGKGKPVTRYADRSIGSITWLYDSRRILFMRDQSGDENWQAHRIDLETGDILALTPDGGVTCYVQQGSPKFPSELLIAHNARDRRYFDIYRIDSVTGGSTLVEQNDQAFAFHFTDWQFRVLFAARQTDDAAREYFRRDAAGAWQRFARIEMEDTMGTRPVEVSADGSELFWLDSRGRDTAAAVAEDWPAGTRRSLADDPKADMTGLLLDPATYRPLAAASMYTRTRWQAIDPGFAADLDALGKIADGDLNINGVSQDKRHWIAYFERAGASGEYFHFDRKTGKSRSLFLSRPDLKGRKLVAMEPVVLRARDGLELVCYLSRPRHASKDKPGPLVLLVHGGPWARDVWAHYPSHQWLADRGYAVLSVNYRGSTGFGKSFINAANMEWAGKMHDDLIDAVDWAIGEGIADPKRVAIYGGSYGGYATLVGLTFTPEKFACGVDLFGISNVVTLMEALPPYWKPWQTIWKMRTGDYTTEAGRQFLVSRSPIARVDKIVRPLLIGQGANDVRVKPAESEQIVAAMQTRDIPVTYVYYSDEGHGFRRPENRRSFNAVAEAFLAQHLGGPCEPVGDDFKGSTIEFRAGKELIRGLA